MTDVDIRVHHLTKEYRIRHALGISRYTTLQESLAQTPYRLMSLVKGRTRSGESRHETFRALDDLTFEVRQGEVLGIIGRNGAGKSTLLKILARVTEPTDGHAEIYGRVGSLLEIGTGFHPELTGRENLFLSGTLLGMKRHEVARCFDEIVAFAEVERFIDTPVKRYSSGMYMRLAFAVAAHLRTEILLVDEVLAVGDSAFQRKCLGTMGDASRAGRTVFFVSHTMTAIKALCRRAIWLERGRIVGDGDPDGVVASYLEAGEGTCEERSWPDPRTAPGNEYIRMQSARVVRHPPAKTSRLDNSTPFTLQFRYWNFKPNVRLNLSVMVYNQDEVCVFSSTTIDEPAWDGKLFPTGLFESQCLIPGHLLNAGSYRVILLFVQDTVTIVHSETDVLGFHVDDDGEGRGDWHGRWPGTVRPKLRWSTELLEASEPESSLTSTMAAS